MISLRNYLKMDRSAWRELLLRTLLPNHVNGQISIHELPHHRYSLNDHPELFDPAKNLPFQGGSIEGFIVNDATCWPSAGVIRVPGGQSIEESYFDPRDIAVALVQIRPPLEVARPALGITLAWHLPPADVLRPRSKLHGLWRIWRERVELPGHSLPVHQLLRNLGPLHSLCVGVLRIGGVEPLKGFVETRHGVEVYHTRASSLET